MSRFCGLASNMINAECCMDQLSLDTLRGHATYSDKLLPNCVLFCSLPRKPLTSSRKTKLHCTFFMPYATISLHAMFDFFIAMSGLFVAYFWCVVFSVYFKNSYFFSAVFICTFGICNFLAAFIDPPKLVYFL